jgi:CRISPR-associated Csx14 family protein
MTEEIKENRRKSKEKIDRGEYDVFLSYNHKDHECVKEIGKSLMDNGIAPWLDKWELQPGLPWQPELYDKIKIVKSAAIFIGKAGIGSWQKGEMYAFERECKKRRCPVIPVLLPDVTSDTELPQFLEGMTWVDYRKKDPHPLKHLIWGITGKKTEKIYLPGVLIASLGDSPVIVSSMYNLLREQEELTIDRVTVLLPNDEEVQHAYELVKEALPNSKELQLRPELLDFSDADSWENACIFLQRLYRLLDNYQRQGDSVYLSLAGGRKSMAALMAWVVPFFPCVKKLYHVIDKEEEQFRSAYQIEMQSSSRRAQLMHPDLNQLFLVEIPFERGKQISEKFHTQLDSSLPKDYEVAEAIIVGRTILQEGTILRLRVTNRVIEQFYMLWKQNVVEAHAVRNSLMEMSRSTRLREHEIGENAYTPKSAKPRVTLHYFTGLKAQIHPVFYTLPTDIYSSSDDEIKEVVICSLEQEGANGYRKLKEVAASPDFSVKDYSSIDTLPPVPSPADTVLIVPLGKSPMVATQLYTLLTEQEKHTIHEVVLIYPQGSTEILNGAELIDQALHKEYGVPCRLVGIPELEDIADKDACIKYQEHLEAEIKRVKQEHPSDWKIDLALSGGRKGMTAMTIFAAQNVHIPYVYHTLITDGELSERIEEETTVEALNDTRLSLQEAYDRLFLRAYRAEEPYPYVHFVLFRVPVFSADGW